MPLRGRITIKTLEMRLPLPRDEIDPRGCDDMSNLFPNLQRLTLFFDQYPLAAPPFNKWWSLPSLTTCVEFYRALQTTMPRATKVCFDLRTLQTNENSEETVQDACNFLIQGINEVWGDQSEVRRANSAYIDQEMRNADRYYAQQKTIGEGLKEEFGDGVMDEYCNLLSYQLRQHGGHSDVCAFITDDDTEDETEHFDEWDLNAEVVRHRDRLQIGRFW